MTSKVNSKDYEWGAPTAEHTLSKLEIAMFLTVSLALFILSGILVILGEGAALIIALPGVALLIYIILKRDYSARVFSEGISYTKWGKTDLIAWDDIVAVWQNLTRHYIFFFIPLGTHHHYTIQLRNGNTFTFDSSLAKAGKLGETIQQQVTSRILPRALDIYNAGQTIPFGNLSISKAGISQGKETLPWNQVKGVKINKGTIYIEKEGKWLNWASVPVAETPNIFVFVALVDQIVGIKK